MNNYPNPFRYGGQTGYYSDLNGNIGLILCTNRWYLPSLGRWISQDPIAYLGGTNLYGYCGGDPINGIDPTGTECWKQWAKKNSWWLKPLAMGIAGALGKVAGGAVSAGAGAFVGGPIAVGLTSMAWEMLINDRSLKDAAWIGAQDGLMDLVGGALMNKLGSVVKSFLSNPAIRDALHLGCETGNLQSQLLKGLKLISCFTAGTMVQAAVMDTTAPHSARGYHVVSMPIEQMKQGDLVAARDEKTGKTEYRRIEQTSIRKVTAIYTLVLANKKSGNVVETIHATKEHPFYVDGKGFVPAGSLAIGNAIVTRAGPPVIVKSVTIQNDPKGVLVYNFTVEGDHSYFVGSANGGLWVHNAGNCQANRAAGKLWEKTLVERYQAAGVDAVLSTKGVETIRGWRFPDIEIHDSTGKVIQYVEAKLGSSKYLAEQQKKDLWIQVNNGISTVVRRRP